MALSLSDLERPTNSPQRSSPIAHKSPKARAKASAVRPWSAKVPQEEVWSFSLREWIQQKYQSRAGFYLPRPKIMRRII